MSSLDLNRELIFIYMSILTAININNVSKEYRHDIFHGYISALLNLNLCVQFNEVFGIIGPNGAGKSTTLKILLGFVRPDHGQVSLFGQPPHDSLVHRRIGYLPENPYLFDNLSAYEHLVFAARTTGMDKNLRKERIAKTLEMVELSHAAHKKIKNYSKGMVQRAALAYALLHEPELLILDEPMSGLDPIGRELVVNIIRDYHARGNTILFCSHVLVDVERICDRICILDKGQIQALITPGELRNQESPPWTEKRQWNSPLEKYFHQTLKHEDDAESVV